ncbi:MAG: hypothetical protein JO062_28745 [Bryobacterales bacterium]|nr:hypothetical protein [Bryobacterales bacterium]
MINRLVGDRRAIFNLVGALTKYSAEPVSKAAIANASAAIVISGSTGWKLPNGIAFSLTPEAKCSISVSNRSTAFPVAMNIDSPETTPVSMGPQPGKVYVNIELDFDITGSVSGSGAAGPVGIAGKVSGSGSKTLVYCQPLDAGANTIEAVKQAFSGLVFPLDPACATKMKPGCLAKVSFDGAFKCELDATYGLGDYKVSAPSLGTIQRSLQNVATLTPASIDMNAGAKASISYSHADRFAMIVTKTDDSAAMLYLVRSDESDWGASAKVTVGVTVAGASVSIDPAVLQAAAGKITGNHRLATSVANAASNELADLQSMLRAKLNTWISQPDGLAGLSATLQRQKGHTALFTFRVDLANADLASQSWSALVGGSVAQALRIKGFTLQSGSGVADSLKRSCTIQFHFFNLFSFSSTTDYFNNAYTELGPDGTIRILVDIGEERDTEFKNKVKKLRIHFLASATEDALNNPTKATVDLCVEILQKGIPGDAGVGNVLSFVPGSASIHAAQSGMAAYGAKNPAGTLHLNSLIKEPAYRKLAATAYNGSKPAPLPHGEDQSNWTAFQGAVEMLMPRLGFASRLNFAFWMNYNRACNDRIGSTMTPDRRKPGNTNAVPDSFFAAIGSSPGLIKYFLNVSAGFMNLCDDLRVLANAASHVDCMEQWNNVITLISTAMNDDVSLDYTKAIAGALLRQCSAGGARATATVEQAKDTLTCTLTLA